MNSVHLISSAFTQQKLGFEFVIRRNKVTISHIFLYSVDFAQLLALLGLLVAVGVHLPVPFVDSCFGIVRVSIVIDKASRNVGSLSTTSIFVDSVIVE